MNRIFHYGAVFYNSIKGFGKTLFYAMWLCFIN